MTLTIFFATIGAMNRRDIIIGLVILVVIAGGVFFLKRPKQTPLEIENPSVEQIIEDKFNFQVPDDADKAQLKDVVGGTSSGIAVRLMQNEKYSFTILADLPDPKVGETYQAWLTKGQEGQEGYGLKSLGSLQIAKGGYLIELSYLDDFADYKNVVVTLETKADSSPEKHILEGSFK